MIDTIWLILHHSTVNYKINFMAEVGAKINVDIKRSNEYRIVGSLQNMQSILNRPLSLSKAVFLNIITEVI